VLDTGVILDVETTGLNPKSDVIIEIGLIEFGVLDDGNIQVLGCYGGLEDAKRPIDPVITKITGLTAEVLQGKAINWDLVLDTLQRSSVIVAHNAAFDRSFVWERPELKGIRGHWACSCRHIDWKAKGFASQKLTYLAADHGFLNPFPHRAVFDCATTLRLVSPYIAELMARSYEPEVQIWAVGAPFESKDHLKQRGYRWDSERRVWGKLIMKPDLNAERDFLAGDIYRGSPKHIEEQNYFNLH
jgi:DNA polymerase-3 subunit epsilon